MICPKCGQTVQSDTVICGHCNFILDTDFLGQDILDEEKEMRPGKGGVSPAMFNLRNANILNDAEDGVAASFENSDGDEDSITVSWAFVRVWPFTMAIAPDTIPAVDKMPAPGIVLLLKSIPRRSQWKTLNLFKESRS